MATQQLALRPLTALAGEMENNFNRFLDDVAGGAPPEIRDILFESRQSTMGRALVADAIDVIPVVGTNWKVVWLWSLRQVERN